MNDAELADFDRYSRNYEEIMAKALGSVGGEATYYLSQKVKLLKSLLPHLTTPVVMDFGSGVGGAVPFLRDVFLPARLICVDESIESLKKLGARYPEVQTALLGDVADQSVDLIFVANVLHHIPKQSRGDVLGRVVQKLTVGGLIAFFEHNPLNPLTRRVVASCEFDAGVELLGRKDLRRLIEQFGNLTIERNGYCMFIPEPFRILANLDRFFVKVPLGAQHFVIGKRSS